MAALFWNQVCDRRRKSSPTGNIEYMQVTLIKERVVDESLTYRYHSLSLTLSVPPGISFRAAADRVNYLVRLVPFMRH